MFFWFCRLASELPDSELRRTLWVCRYLRVITILVRTGRPTGLIKQSGTVTCQFCRTEKAAHDQTVDRWRKKPVWFEVALSFPHWRLPFADCKHPLQSARRLRESNQVRRIFSAAVMKCFQVEQPSREEKKNIEKWKLPLMPVFITQTYNASSDLCIWCKDDPKWENSNWPRPQRWSKPGPCKLEMVLVLEFWREKSKWLAYGLICNILLT